MTHPAFEDLYLLTVLQATASFTGAARRIGVSKASVSARIAALERAAGVPLVSRTTRSVALTPAGQQLVEGTRSAFGQIEQSFASVRDLADMPSGLVRLTAPVALGRQHVAPLLPAFLQAYPQVRLELHLGDRLLNLAHEGMDLAIRHVQAPPPTHVAWKLCASRSMLVGSRRYLRERGKPESPADLAAHTCLLYMHESDSRSWTFERRGARKAERVTVPVAGGLRANNSEVLRDAVLSGAGIALLPDFSASRFLGAGKLVELLPDWQPLDFFGDAIYAVRPWAAHVPRAVRVLVEHLRQHLRPGFG